MRGARQPVTLSHLMLLRAGVAGSSGIAIDQLAKDLRALTGPLKGLEANGTALPRAIADWCAEAAKNGHILVQNGSDETVRIAGDGMLALAELFGDSMLRKDWKTICERHLIARALNMPVNAGTHRLKRLETAPGLRLAVVRKGWTLRVPEGATIGQVRSALAARSLGEAFGKAVQGQIGPDPRLSAKAGRTIAAQLLKKKRRVASDAQLITALAAEDLDIANCDLRSMRQALIRRLIRTDEKEKSRVDTATLDEVANQANPSPDAIAFLRAVRSSAKLNANGWSGNRKAYISHVWRTLRDSRPDWRLSEKMFKSMLADAHREGALVLVNADLRDKANIRDIQESAVQYKNMEWHFVQVADS